MRLQLALCFLALASAGVGADAKAEELLIPKRKDLHVYLLLGQSNMAGRGKIGEEDKTTHPRVWRLNYSNVWEVAVEPIHQDRAKGLGVGPGLTFGKIMAEREKKAVIALVPCAVGGTPLSRWSKGGDLYSNALLRASAAMQAGTLKGILWHQGENDSIRLETAETYQERLITMIQDLRRDLKQPDVPFVAGQIGEFLYTRKDATATPYARMINEALAAMPRRLPNTACWTASGLTHHGDEVHFDTASQHEMGRRYAAELLKLQKKRRSQPVR